MARGQLMEFMRRSIARLSLALFFSIVAVTGSAHSQTMDYKLNQAKRSVAEIATGLQSLKKNDVSTYNRLSAKLTKAAEQLKTTESRTHPDFSTTVQQWRDLQKQMAQIGASWQASRNQQKKPATAQQQQQPASTRKQPTPADQSVASTNLDPLMEKYKRQSHPVLAEKPTPEQAATWAGEIRALQTTHLQRDLATIESATNSGAASPEDARRVRHWITTGFQDRIQERVNQEIKKNVSIIRGATITAELINGLDPTDMNKAYNFASGDNGQNNKATLDDGLRAALVADVLDRVFGQSNADLAEQVIKLKAARIRFSDMEILAAEQAKNLAKAPKKQRAIVKDFLAPIAQKFWLNGSMVAESEADGSIWIDSRDVGDVTNNGKIWIGSNEIGAIEPDGRIWFDSSWQGSIESNGEVWRRGKQVGLIEPDGTVWAGGSASGEIVPFQGEWKRAAFVYFFRDVFVR